MTPPPSFISEFIDHWQIISTMIGLVAGTILAFVYTQKVIIPKLIQDVSGLRKEVTAIDRVVSGMDGLMTIVSCEALRGECVMHRRDRRTDTQKQLEELTANVQKIFDCVSKSERQRKRGQAVTYGFMTAVKEKLQLEFDPPQDFLSD
jgi:hypothetical protein